MLAVVVASAVALSRVDLGDADAPSLPRSARPHHEERDRDEYCAKPSADMGVIQTRSFFSGTRAAIAEEWSHATFEHQEVVGDDDDEEYFGDFSGDEDYQMPPLPSVPAPCVDNRILRPGATNCRNWSAQGSCHFGQGCHFRHGGETPAYRQAVAAQYAAKAARVTAGPTGYYKLNMQEPDKQTDDLFDELEADPRIAAALGLPLRGDFDLRYSFENSVQRVGHSEETTNIVWRIRDPSILLDPAQDQGGGQAAAELLQLVEKELQVALSALRSVRFDHSYGNHARRVQQEGYLSMAQSLLPGALAAVHAARAGKPWVQPLLEAAGAVWDFHGWEQKLFDSLTEERSDNGSQPSDDELDDEEEELNETFRMLDPGFDAREKRHDADDDDPYDPYDGVSCLRYREKRYRRQDAYECDVKSRSLHHVRGYHSGGYLDDGGCNCSEVARDKSGVAQYHMRKALDALGLCTSSGAPKPKPIDKTDAELLAAAAQKHTGEGFRAFLRRAATAGHEVIIKHNVG